MLINLALTSLKCYQFNSATMATCGSRGKHGSFRQTEEASLISRDGAGYKTFLLEESAVRQPEVVTFHSLLDSGWIMTLLHGLSKCVSFSGLPGWILVMVCPGIHEKDPLLVSTVVICVCVFFSLLYFFLISHVLMVLIGLCLCEVYPPKCLKRISGG